MFGRGDKVFCDLLLQGRYPVMIGNGRNMLDFVHVDDVAAGHIASVGVDCFWMDQKPFACDGGDVAIHRYRCLVFIAAHMESSAQLDGSSAIYILGGRHMSVEEFVCGAAERGGDGTTRWGHARPWRLPVRLAKWMAFFNELVCVYCEVFKDHWGPCKQSWTGCDSPAAVRSF